MLCIITISSYAQQTSTAGIPTGNIGTVKGIVRDTAHNYVLRSATVSIYKASDSSLINYQISNNYGEFNFKLLPVDVKLRLDVSYVGYKNFRKVFTIPTGTNTLDLKTLIIEPKDNTLEDVVISVPPITMNGDTLEFNAAAFKLDSNAVVEDLLRKIPNITLWGDGQITVNGREVKSVLVNGKPFFGGDVKTATQNIAKNALQKVQVYSTALNKANPLDSTLQMNLKLKKGKDIGYFGKIGGGYGTSGRYEGDASFNVFSPKMNIAIVGATNNVNKTPWGVQQMVSNSTFKGVGTNVEYQPDFRSSGITTPRAGGATFSYNFVEKPTYEDKAELRADYFITDKITDINSETQTNTVISDSTGFMDKSSSSSRNSSTNQRFSSAYEMAKKGHSLSIDHSMTMNEGDNVSNSLRSTQNQNNVLTSTNTTYNESNFNNKANNQPAAIGGPTVLYRPNVPRNESIFIPPSIETTITSGSWVCNYSFRQLERYNCKFKMHDLIRGQYITIAKSHNFFGFLPKTITIKIASEEEHKLSKPLEQSNLHTPKPNSKEIFLNATYLGNSIKKICSD
ncbi:MAG: hypothetical protein EOO92_15850, partial [Pedobacter sp.]